MTGSKYLQHFRSGGMFSAYSRWLVHTETDPRKDNHNRLIDEPSDILWSPCLDRSELFWWHKGNLPNIRQVVSTLWLLGVYSPFYFTAGKHIMLPIA